MAKDNKNLKMSSAWADSLTSNNQIKLLEESLSQLNESFDLIIKQTWTPYEQLFQAQKTISDLVDACNKMFSSYTKQVTDILDDLITECLNMYDFTNALNNYVTASLNSLSDAPSNKYIEIDTDTINKIEENIIEIPQDLYIHISTKTIHIRIDFFISLVGLFVTIIFGIIATIQGTSDNTAYSEITAQEIQYMEAQTALLSEILQNLSTSDEETAEILHSLQQSLDTGNSLSQETLRHLDAVEESFDSIPECDCIQTSTESE